MNNALAYAILGMGALSGYRKEYAPMATQTKIAFLGTLVPLYYLRMVNDSPPKHRISSHLGYLGMATFLPAFGFCIGSFVGRELYRGHIGFTKRTEGGS